MSEKTITCLNGQFLPAAQAMLPVADRGFRFGDGIFETVLLHRSVPYQWELHLHRMLAGLAALRITPPNVDWQRVVRDVITRNKAAGGFLRISISRGVGSHGYMPEANILPNWVIELLPASVLPSAPYTLFHSSITRPTRTSLPVNYKLAHGIASTLALMEARDHHADDALILSQHHVLCETASANLFWLHDGALYTPALETGCLDGTTRAAIMRLSPVPVHEVTQHADALTSAEALFISNTRLGLWPVTMLLPEGRRFNTQHPVISEMTSRLMADRDTYAATHATAWAA
jgi:branched-subunit amino acid aminotransferase/4-amino-4-deoxychorismate lyase